jgi:ABC-type nitrate/sulfonate/bicarbonate transport system permease component
LKCARLEFGLGWRVRLAAKTPGTSSSVGYRLRHVADLIHTGRVSVWAITPAVVMAAFEMNILKPLENYLFR